MADIFHSLRMSASPEDIFRAVADETLVRRWWPQEQALAMRRVVMTEGAQVAWRCVAGPAEWVGTDIAFSLAREGSETVVRLAHRNWREVTDAFAQCTTKWGRVLFALKSRVETPEAEDLHV